MDSQKNQTETLPKPTETMETQTSQTENPTKRAESSSSCRKHVKDDNATFLANLKDHMNEFVNASMDEHKTCIKNTMDKIIGIAKGIAEKKAETKEVESHSPLQATAATK